MSNKMLSNKKTTDSINMGQMIKKVLKERGISISDFAKAIHCSRTNVYGIFKRQSIDIERLKQIANVLELDVADFIVLKRRESNKRVVIVEINEEDLEQLLNEYDLTYIKHWKVK